MPNTNQSALPNKYKWLENEKFPKILLEALKLYGTKEIKGGQHNPEIISWAQELGGWVSDYYKADEIAWCGLFMGICAKRAGYEFTQEVLSARAWLKWGIPSSKPMLGDVLIFSRDGGGHVGLYVGEDKNCFHVLGGNQGDSVSIVRIVKARLIGSRRCKWKIGQPKNIRQIRLSNEGEISTNET